MAEKNSTNVALRLDADLKEKLVRRADANERSLNAEITTRLRESLTRRRDEVVSVLLQCLDLPKVVRIRTSSTTADASRIGDLCERLEVSDLVLAAAPNDLNGAVLVVVLQTESAAFLMDTSWVNMARDPRIGEVAKLFVRLDQLGLLDSARFCTKLVPATADLTPSEAVEAIVREGKPTGRDLGKFLDLLSRHSQYDLAKFRARSRPDSRQ